MSFLPENTILGKLTILEVFVYYDRPVLFACRNSIGTIYQYLRQIGKHKKGLSDRLEVDQNPSSPGKALDRNHNTFGMHRTAIGSIESPTTHPSHLWHAGRDGTRHDAGAFALDRERRQLSKHPTFLSQRTSLESDPVVVFSKVFFEARRRVHCGR